MKAAAADGAGLDPVPVGSGLPLIAGDENGNCHPLEFVSEGSRSGLQFVASLAAVPIRRSALTRHSGVLRKLVCLAKRPT